MYDFYAFTHVKTVKSSWWLNGAMAESKKVILGSLDLKACKSVENSASKNFEVKMCDERFFWKVLDYHTQENMTRQRVGGISNMLNYNTQFHA